MLRTLPDKLILFVGLLLLCNTAPSVAAQGGSDSLVSPELLKHAKLKILWQNELPLKKNENLDRLFILGDRICALSDRNYMVCLDRRAGNTIFGRSMAPAGFPVLGLELYRNELISIIGNKLVELDPETAAEYRVKPLEFAAVCPAARNSRYFYLSAPDRRLRALRADNKVHVFEVAAENESLITSIVADERFVVFGTDAGNVISILPDRPTKLWQFNAADAIAGSIVKDGMSLFFASKDTNVYRLDIVNVITAGLVWKHQLPGIPQDPPRVTENLVYQSAGGHGLTAIDKYTGRSIWSLQQGADLLAEAAGKAYVIADDNTLVVMDNSRAKRLCRVNFAQVSRYATNTTDSKIYIADKGGRIACLEPVK